VFVACRGASACACHVHSRYFVHAIWVPRRSSRKPRRPKSSLSSTGDVKGIVGGGLGITTNALADFANGNATITPIKDGLPLDTVTFTPDNGNLFDSFDFRGQPLADLGIVTVTVQDNQGDAPQTLPPITGLSASADFGAIGIIAVAGSGETIQWVSITDSVGFKEAKQFEFDVATAVPEPATWMMLLLGFAGLGFAGYRKSRSVLRIA
jgi:hypothetical protein